MSSCVLELRIILMLPLLIVLSLPVFAEDRRCGTLPYFQSKLIEYNYLTNRYRGGKYYYDASLEKERFVTESSYEKIKSPTDVLILWQKKKQYIVDLDTMACTVTEPHGEFHPIEVGDGYHHVEDVVIGSLSEEGVEIGVWAKEVNTTDVKGVSVIEFTKRHCLPFYLSFEGSWKGEKIHYFRSYMNIDKKQEDPKVFDVPEACLK